MEQTIFSDRGGHGRSKGAGQECGKLNYILFLRIIENFLCKVDEVKQHDSVANILCAGLLMVKFYFYVGIILV